MRPTSTDRNTQRGRILARLLNARGGWVSLPEIFALGVAQSNARIFELHGLGFPIQNYQEGGHSFFRLAPGPGVPAPAVPTTPACTESLFPMTGVHRDDG